MDRPLLVRVSLIAGNYSMLRKALFALTLWGCFAFGCFVAPFVAILLIFPVVWKIDYFRNFVKAADRLCAAQLGYSGRVMLSTELVYSTRLQWMRKALDEIDQNGDKHCIESAWTEGPYSRLSDRQIRAK